MSESPLFLDTETTGLDDQAEICEIAVIDIHGQVLINTLVKTILPIPDHLTEFHGISNAMVAGSPTFAQLLPRLNEILAERTVLVYNAQFDEQMIANSARLSGFPISGDDAVCRWWWNYEVAPGKYKSNWHCAMKLYATYYGDFNHYHGNYRWQRLEAAATQCSIRLPQQLHRTHADAELTRRLVLYMAGQATITEIKQGESNEQPES
jgi:DNA polymerase-3 subunit epsilon